MTAPPQHIVAVSGAFFDGSGRLLLVRVPRRGWECPGGQVEEGEDLLSALARAVQDEAGVAVTVERLVGVYTNPAPPPKVMFHFVGRWTGGEVQPGDGCQEAGWFTPQEALMRVTFPANRAKLRDALAPDGPVAYRAYTARPYAVALEREL